LNRTSAACGFRWNAEVRSNYIEAMELAKRQRKERKRALAKETKKTPNFGMNSSRSSTLSLNQVVEFLKQLDEDYTSSNQSKTTIERMKRENDSLQNEVNQLKMKLKTTEKHLYTMKEDYETFIQIMDRARKMTVFKDDSPGESPKFSMDKNGNLQKIIQSLN